jgi:hypothetical protein
MPRRFSSLANCRSTLMGGVLVRRSAWAKTVLAGDKLLVELCVEVKLSFMKTCLFVQISTNQLTVMKL